MKFDIFWGQLKFYWRCGKKGGNKLILMIFWLKMKNRSHILSPQKKVLVIVVAWVETRVRSIDCRLANHEIKLVLSVFYFLESFWSPSLCLEQFKKKEVFEISIHSSRWNKFLKTQYIARNKSIGWDKFNTCLDTYCLIKNYGYKKPNLGINSSNLKHFMPYLLEYMMTKKDNQIKILIVMFCMYRVFVAGFSLNNNQRY